jgi:hypothetical protein
MSTARTGSPFGAGNSGQSALAAGGSNGGVNIPNTEELERKFSTRCLGDWWQFK